MVSLFKSFAFSHNAWDSLYTRSVLLLYLPSLLLFFNHLFTDSEVKLVTIMSRLPNVFCVCCEQNCLILDSTTKLKEYEKKHFRQKYRFIFSWYKRYIETESRDNILAKKPLLEDFTLEVYHLQIWVSIHALFCRLKCSVSILLYHSFKLKWENLRNTIFWGCGFLRLC